MTRGPLQPRIPAPTASCRTAPEQPGTCIWGPGGALESRRPQVPVHPLATSRPGQVHSSPPPAGRPHTHDPPLAQRSRGAPRHARLAAAGALHRAAVGAGGAAPPAAAALPRGGAAPAAAQRAAVAGGAARQDRRHWRAGHRAGCCHRVPQVGPGWVVGSRARGVPGCLGLEPGGWHAVPAVQLPGAAAPLHAHACGLPPPYQPALQNSLPE